MGYRILDLFCGAGAVSAGLVAAGFEVVGVDLEPQGNYPYPFLRHDALTLDRRFLRSFDAIWASPPCQAWTALKHAPNGKAHFSVIGRTRLLLASLDKPYVIENVEGAPLRNPVCLCGSMFRLGVPVGGVFYQLQRHRLFEANFPIPEPPCRHTRPVIGIYGGHVRNRAKTQGGRGTADFTGADKKTLAMVAMGIEHAQTMDEISQAIPPAYARHVGDALMDHLESIRWGLQ